MRFGLFIPQGWRMDLVGIDPADQWATMNGLVTRADAGATFESVWVYDHFHTVPEPTQEATHEAWTLMAAFAAPTPISIRPPLMMSMVAATFARYAGLRYAMQVHI